MPKRRSPIRHPVRGHTREGKPVEGYQRGKGTKPQGRSKVVGTDSRIVVSAGEDVSEDAWFKGMVTIEKDYYGAHTHPRKNDAWVIEWIRQMDDSIVYGDKEFGHQFVRDLQRFGTEKFEKEIRKQKGVDKPTSTRLNVKDLGDKWLIKEHDWKRFEFTIPKRE